MYRPSDSNKSVDIKSSVDSQIPNTLNDIRQKVRDLFIKTNFLFDLFYISIWIEYCQLNSNLMAFLVICNLGLSIVLPVYYCSIQFI